VILGKATAPEVGISVLQSTLSGPATVPVPIVQENGLVGAFEKKLVRLSSTKNPNGASVTGL
jgi:hypothetical protein